MIFEQVDHQGLYISYSCTLMNAKFMIVIPSQNPVYQKVFMIVHWWS